MQQDQNERHLLFQWSAAQCRSRDTLEHLNKVFPLSTRFSAAVAVCQAHLWVWTPVLRAKAHVAKRRKAIAGIQRIIEQVRFSAKLASGKMFVRPQGQAACLSYLIYFSMSVSVISCEEGPSQCIKQCPVGACPRLTPGIRNKGTLHRAYCDACC